MVRRYRIINGCPTGSARGASILIVGLLTISGLAARSGSAAQGNDQELPTVSSTRDQAVQLARSGELDTALVLIKKALVESDNDPEVLADYIAILAWNEKWEQAVTVFEAFCYPELLPSYVLPEIARCYRMAGRFAEAIYLYRRYVQDNPEDHDAFKGLVCSLLDAGRLNEAREQVEQRLEQDPKDARLLFLKGEVLEKQREYIQAVSIYEQILAAHPESQAARNLKVRALLELGAASLVRDQIEAVAGRIDPVLQQRAKGDTAMYRIRWNEAGQALEAIDKELALYEKADDTEIDAHYLRSRCDRILALRAQARMEEVIREYGELGTLYKDIPCWVHQAAADACLYLQEPEQALALYKLVLGEQPKSHQARIALFHTLVELRRFREAGTVLEALDRDTPPRIVERGILRKNWKKAEIAYARAWLIMYQDRLKEAESYLREISLKAPLNANLRNARAHNYFWRGWPRLAREELEIIQTLDPKNPAAANGYCIVLNAHDREEEARQRIQELCLRHPGNRHVQRTRRQFEIEDMRKLTIDASFAEEHPGAEEIYLSVRLDQPVTYHHTVFAEMVRQDTDQPGESYQEDRLYLGVEWERSPTWRVRGAVSAEYDRGGNFGWLLGATYAPNDYLTFDAGYETEILSIPLHSRVTGVEGNETTLAAAYRASELFTTTLRTSLRDLSDGNDTWSCTWTTDTGLTTRAWWKTRLLTEFYASRNSKTDVAYFSPDYRRSFYLIPMAEHTWYRRYEKSLVDRLFLGIGRQWQKDFARQGIWFVRYEQDYKISDTHSWLIGTQYWQRNYDGEDVNELNIYTKLTKYF